MRGMDDALHETTASRLRDLLRAGELTPTEVADHFLARIERANPGLGAFVSVTPEAARERAARLERDGADGGGVLWGLPGGDKDLWLRAGVPTGLGSRAFAGDDAIVPPVSDEIVDVLDAAGMVSLGRTTAPELGFPAYTEPLAGPVARNPWDPTLGAGGSSGGAAVAVAAGLSGDVHRVAARVGLGDREAGLQLPGGDLRQELGALRLRPVAGDGQPAERGGEQVHERRGAARAALGERLQRDRELEEALPGAAVLLGDREAVPAARDQLPPHLLGPPLLGVAPAPVLLVVLPGDGPHAVAHRDRALRQVEVHASLLASVLFGVRSGRAPDQAPHRSRWVSGH